MTAGRQNSLILDGLGAWDPMGAAPVFSVIGASNTVVWRRRQGVRALQHVDQVSRPVGPLQIAALYQIGGFGQGNGSNGAFSTEIEGDFGAFAFDAVGQQVKDAVSLSSFTENPLPSGVSPNALKATLSNNTSGDARPPLHLRQDHRLYGI